MISIRPGEGRRGHVRVARNLFGFLLFSRGLCKPPEFLPFSVFSDMSRGVDVLRVLLVALWLCACLCLCVSALAEKEEEEGGCCGGLDRDAGLEIREVEFGEHIAMEEQPAAVEEEENAPQKKMTPLERAWDEIIKIESFHTKQKITRTEMENIISSVWEEDAKQEAELQKRRQEVCGEHMASIEWEGKTFEYCDHQLVQVDGATFHLGTHHPVIPQDKEHKWKSVTSKSFAIDKFEITNGQFARFLQETQYTPEGDVFDWSFALDAVLDEHTREKVNQWVEGFSWWAQVWKANWRYPEGSTTFDVFKPRNVPYAAGLKGARLYPDVYVDVQKKKDTRAPTMHRLDEPVVHVTWNDAKAFCAYRNMQLPTEYEWELAARNPSMLSKDTKYSWGDTLEPEGEHRMNVWQGEFPHNNTAKDGFSRRAPVYAFAASERGLHHMLGNVWEWVDQPSNFLQGDLLKKGGSYMCHESYCYRYRISARSGNTADSGADNLGFRCVQRSMDQQELVMRNKRKGRYEM